MGDFIPFVKVGIAFNQISVYSYMRGTKACTVVPAKQFSILQ